MNLSPEWAGFLISNGFDAVHWSSVGEPDARDAEILAWARDHGRVVFTHDLDFGIALSLSRESGPSVIQIRSQNITPRHLGGMVVDVLRSHAKIIVRGALVTIVSMRRRLGSVFYPFSEGLTPFWSSRHHQPASAGETAREERGQAIFPPLFYEQSASGPT